MKLMMTDKTAIPLKGVASLARRTRIQSWLFSWEIYLIVLVAGFLRLYAINTTEFDGDQADIFRMAYDAVSHGLQVATSNVASIRIFNPPGIIYLLMIPAAFSSDPLWAAVLVALLAIVSVLLTYAFMRRYYGRVAATFAALLYATALLPVFYSRFIWNQNLLLFFVPLFMMALFWGVVERRKGWLFPALLLLGLLLQLHGSGAVMAAPLLVALLLAPGTVRWRDLLLGLFSLSVLYGSYLIWEIYTHFSDITILLNTTKQPVQIDAMALLFYQQFLSTYSVPFASAGSLLSHLVRVTSWVEPVMTLLVLAAGVAVLWGGIWPSRGDAVDEKKGNAFARFWMALKRWWIDLRAAPSRCGLLVLFVWQAMPLLYLSRHSINLFPHYFIIMMPGPFILIGLLLAQLVEWGRRHAAWGQALHVGTVALAVLIILAQLAASTANVLDLASGKFDAYALSVPYYNDLSSLQQALKRADEIAQQQHVKRIYISAEFATENALRYLAPQLHTPTTVFNNVCLVLPGVTQGPSLLLVGPYDDMAATLATQYASASLLAELKRLGGPPFKLYIVQPATMPSVARVPLGQNLQLLDIHTLHAQNTTWLVSRWDMLHSEAPAYRTTYGYTIKSLSGAATSANIDTKCIFSSLQAGDQLLVGLRPANILHPTIEVRIQSFTTIPYIISPQLFRPISLSFLTDRYQDIARVTLKAADGSDAVTLSP